MIVISKNYCQRKDNNIKNTVFFIVMAILFLHAHHAFSNGTHACDYLHKDDVAKILKQKIAKVEQQPPNPMGQSICFFDIDGGMAVRFAQLQMMRSGWQNGKGTKFEAPVLFENNMSFLEGLKEVDGLGEKAYWGGSGLKMGAGLHILYKDAYFTVMVATGNPDENFEKSKKLAQLILSRIK